MQRPLAITGLGVVSPLGLGMGALWDGLTGGATALGAPDRLDMSGFACRLAGEVKDFSAKDHLPKHYRKAVKVMARDIELAVVAAKLAVEDAGLTTRAHGAEGAGAAMTVPAERMGCQIGAGLISAEAEELTSALVTATADDGRGGRAFSLKAWGEAGLPNLQPLWMLKYLPNMLACHVTIIHGAEGPSNTITCGEASGLLSLGESCRVIERGAADLCFSGGAESKLNVMGIMRTIMAGKSGPTGEETDGSRLLRPYDPTSVGIPGEAGGILVVEALEHARARGAKVYAEIAGFGAGHAPWPPYLPADERAGVAPEANRGLVLAVRRALKDAGLTAADIGGVVPQAAGAPLEDAAEAMALREVFGDRVDAMTVATVTPNIGNCWAGSGGVQAAVAAMMLSRQAAPGRVHHGRASGLPAGPAAARAAALKNVLVCSSSLGGQSAALVLKASV